MRFKALISLEGYYSMDSKGLSHNRKGEKLLLRKTSIFCWWHHHQLLHEYDEIATTMKKCARRWPYKHQLHHLHHHWSLQPLITNTTIYVINKNNQSLVPYFLRLAMDPQQTLHTSPFENITSISTRTTNTTTASICANYGGVWFVFLNNISRILTHFFTRTYFHKCF